MKLNHVLVWSLALCLQTPVVSAQKIDDEASSRAKERPGLVPKERRGLLMNASVGVGPMYLWSQRNLLTGLEQGPRSRAQGVAWTADGELGGTLARGLTLGGYVHYGQSHDVRVQLGDTRIKLENFVLEQFGTGVSVMILPKPHQGLFMRARLGLFGVTARALPFSDWSSLGDADPRGPEVSATFGREWQVFGHAWLGASAQVQAARVYDGPSSTSFFLPTVRFSATWF